MGARVPWTPETRAKIMATRAAQRAHKQALAAQASAAGVVDSGTEIPPEGAVEISRGPLAQALDALLLAAGFKSLKLFKMSVSTLVDNLKAEKTLYIRGVAHTFPDCLVRVKAAVELLALTGGKPSIQPQALRMKHEIEVHRAEFAQPRRRVIAVPPVSDGAVADSPEAK